MLLVAPLFLAERGLGIGHEIDHLVPGLLARVFEDNELSHFEEVIGAK